jgi:cytochrome c peroxidase
MVLLSLALTACDDDAPAPDPAGPSLSETPLATLVQEVRTLTAGRGIGPLQRPAPVRPELVRLGQALAFDKILSGNKDISCMSCHLPGLATSARVRPGWG